MTHAEKQLKVKEITTEVIRQVELMEYKLMAAFTLKSGSSDLSQHEQRVSNCYCDIRNAIHHIEQTYINQSE